jgi:hypothetical protein
MPYTRSRWNALGTEPSLRLFRTHRSVVFCQLFAVLLAAIDARGQPPSATLEALLASDPNAFAEWLNTSRPAPLSPANKRRILDALPLEGEVTALSDDGRLKLEALRPLLRAVEREGVYEMKVVDSPFARIGLYEGTVLLMSETAWGPDIYPGDIRRAEIGLRHARARSVPGREQVNGRAADGGRDARELPTVQQSAAEATVERTSRAVWRAARSTRRSGCACGPRANLRTFVRDRTDRARHTRRSTSLGPCPACMPRSTGTACPFDGSA